MVEGEEEPFVNNYLQLTPNERSKNYGNEMGVL
jgi:hypothetical protein